MKTYAVIDTNVLVSSMITKQHDAATARVVRCIASGEVIPVYNDEIIGEYLKVLRRPKFSLDNNDINDILSMMLKFGINSERIPSGEEFPDPSDAVFYEVALSKEDSYLVTGNLKHFPQSPIVVTPAQMLEILGID